MTGIARQRLRQRARRLIGPFCREKQLDQMVLEGGVIGLEFGSNLSHGDRLWRVGRLESLA